MYLCLHSLFALEEKKRSSPNFAGQYIQTMHTSGTPDERTLHAGEPTAGEKWVAQLWLHHAPYTPNVPEGSSQAAATPAAREYAAERGLRVPQ